MGFHPINLWESLYGDCLTKLQDAISILHPVEVDIRDNVKNWEVLPAVYAVATITGAPKIRAMETIHEFEDHSRGFILALWGGLMLIEVIIVVN